MRIVSYNILDGGEGRADPLAEVIEAQRADVVALVEATDLAVIERIANRLGMDYVHAPGRSQASALLSKWTIRDSVNHALLRPGISKSLLEATLVDPAGREWSFGVVHLHAHAKESDEAEREREINVVVELFAAKSSCILCGDLNANSPVQKLEFEKLKPSSQKAWTENGGQIPRRAIAKLLSEGFVDTLHAVRGDYAATAGTFSTQQPGQRVDYIFTRGIDRPHLKNAWIEYDRLAKYASDHFPIGVEII